MEPVLKNNLSLTEYQQLEEDTNTRYEYHQGEVFCDGRRDDGAQWYCCECTEIIGVIFFLQTADRLRVILKFTLRRLTKVSIRMCQ